MADTPTAGLPSPTPPGRQSGEARPFGGTWVTQLTQISFAPDGAFESISMAGTERGRWTEARGVLRVMIETPKRRQEKWRWTLGKDRKSLMLTTVLPDGKSGPLAMYGRPAR